MAWEECNTICVIFYGFRNFLTNSPLTIDDTISGHLIRVSAIRICEKRGPGLIWFGSVYPATTDGSVAD